MKRSKSCCTALDCSEKIKVQPLPAPRRSNLSCDGPSSPSASSWMPPWECPAQDSDPAQKRSRVAAPPCWSPLTAQLEGWATVSPWIREALMSLWVGSGKAAMLTHGTQLPPARWALPWARKPRSDPLCFPCWPLAGFSAAAFHYHMQLPDVFHTLRVSQPCTTLGTSSLVFGLPSVNWGMIMCYRFWSQIG